MKIRLETEGKNAGCVHYRGPDSAEMAANYLRSIEADEVIIQLVKEDGTRADGEFSGDLWLISATKFIMSAIKKEQEISSSEEFQGKSLTLKERLEMFLKFEYPRVWFSSLDVKKKYEIVYGAINLSTVSTYLARMYRDSVLERRGNRNQREYRFKDESNPLIGEYVASK